MKRWLAVFLEILLRAVQTPIARGLDWALGRGCWRRFPWLIRGYRFSGRYCERISAEQVRNVLELDAAHFISHLRMTSTGVLQGFCVEQVFFMPCGEVARVALQAGYRHWAVLNDSALKELVDYDFRCLRQNQLYSMEILQLPSPPLNGLEMLARFGPTQLRSLSEFDWLARIERLSAFCEVSAFKCLLVSNQQVQFGLVHGDFHPGNIMENACCRPVLIDLDRMCLSAPRCIDQIHYVMCALEARHSRSWLTILANKGFDEPSFSREQRLAYLLFRAAAETRGHAPGVRYRLRLQAAVQAVGEQF